MLSDLSTDEYDDWLRYYQHRPVRDSLVDHYMSQLLALTYNINRGSSSKPASAHEFMPWVIPPKPQMSGINLSEKIKSNFKRAHNASAPK